MLLTKFKCEIKISIKEDSNDAKTGNLLHEAKKIQKNN